MSRRRFIGLYKNIRRHEYFTRYCDIAKELDKYENAFVDKVVYLNCDEIKYSQYWRYFYDNFKRLGLKKLIATHYSPLVPVGLNRFLDDCEVVHKYEYDGKRFSKKPLIRQSEIFALKSVWTSCIALI